MFDHLPNARRGEDSDDKKYYDRRRRSSTSSMSGVAGPTPFHRRSSWISYEEKTSWLGEYHPSKFRWHIYDNKGSFNGWFDWLPEWMRVGHWSPVACVFLVSFYISLYLYMPNPLTFDVAQPLSSSSTTTDWWYYADVFIAVWGIIVIIQATISFGTIGPFYISYTGWSWQLLVSRAMLDVVSQSSIIVKNYPSLSIKLATIASSIRFPVAVAAVVTFTIWNFVLFPMIYFVATPKGKPRAKFLKFNTSFFMINVHMLNLPLGLCNIVYGGGGSSGSTSSNIRLFTTSDLWVSYVIVMAYSILYLFVLDRVGLHFYPIFCPRTSLCAVSFGLVLYLYWFIMQKFNDVITYMY